MVGAPATVGLYPPSKLGICHQDNVFAVLVAGHLLEKRGHGLVEALQQTLLGSALVTWVSNPPSCTEYTRVGTAAFTAAATMLSWPASDLRLRARRLDGR